MKKNLLLLSLLAAVTAFGGKSNWDATKDGRLMTPTNDIVLFKNTTLSGYRLDSCWFNKARRTRANGTMAMCNGKGTICHERRAEDGSSLTAQCQLCSEGYTKCVKIQLRQAGADIVGRVLYAKYFTKHHADKVGADFDTLQGVTAQDVYSVLPSGIATDGYNVDWLSLREIGGAADNIPEPTDGSMPEDSVLEWMETAADAKQLQAFRAAHPAPFHLFGEDRHYAVRNNILPAHWLAKGNRAAELFRGTAQPGEFYPFQVCVASERARNLRWRALTDLPVTCITPATCAVKANGVKPIWVMLDIPANAAGKTLRGEVEVADAQSGETRKLPFEIAVKGEVLKDGGIADAWRLARLKWLASDIGSEDTVTRPYSDVTVDRATRTVSILGRTLVLGADGLPAQIVSLFNGSNTKITDTKLNLLAAPISFSAEGAGLAPATTSDFQFTSVKKTEAAWCARTRCGNATRIVEGRIDFTGTGFFRVRFETGTTGVSPVAAAALEIHMPSNVARYLEGLGRNGGAFPEQFSYTWDANFQRDALWFGSVNGGLAVRFRGANYRRPFVNAYYAWRKLRLPESWSAGNGNITTTKNGKEAIVRAAAANAPAGAEWNFELYVTPFHTLNLKQHLSERYMHFGQRNRSADLSQYAQKGATVINLHHNTIWNPYINYPYNDDGGPILKRFIEEGHKHNLLMKFYYTTRELTQNLPEFFALKSLDGEIFAVRDEKVPYWPVTNRNGPHPWLQQHVGMDVLPAWRENVHFPAYEPRLDLAVITTPETRWDNFYLEGLDYLVRSYGIDGIYIDDTALSGKAMQRARRILDRDGKLRLVDNHSWNHHDRLAGGGSSNLVFLDLYPYFDLLWRGEGFSNHTPADFWLVERCGLPFGVAGEILGHFNPFRGMLFGMTNRWGWGAGPFGLWHLFDEIHLGDSEMIGWWDDANPVQVQGSDEVKATLYQLPKASVLVVANFNNKEARSVQFKFDAQRLGFDGTKSTWTQPAIDAVQKAGASPDFSKPITIPAQGGVIWINRR